jgi:chromosome segregation ATPase
MKNMEEQIDASIREHYEIKMRELNEEFDRIMNDKDLKAQRDKEAYELQLDKIISELDNKENAKAEQTHQFESERDSCRRELAQQTHQMQQLESDRDCCRKEAQEVAKQLALFRRDVENIAGAEAEEKVKVKNNYEQKLSELYNNNTDLAESNTSITNQVQELQRQLESARSESNIEERELLQTQIKALKME